MPYPAKTDAERILNAALEMFEQQGPQAFSMRNLAAALNIKAPSLYRHYPDKKSLEFSLKMRGASLLQSAIETSIKDQDAQSAIHHTAQTYLEFSRNHPYLYQLMNQGDDNPSRGAGKDLWNTFLRVVGGITQNPDDTSATVAFWAFLHGFCSLEQSKAFGKSGPKAGFEAGLNALITGFSSTPRS